MISHQIITADCLDWMKSQPDDCVDLVFGSPPYEAVRTYGIGFNLRGQDWVDWMVLRMVEMVRISKGLVGMVVEGNTRKYRWSATPALLMADLHRKGICLRKPPIYSRVSIPGSGGPDWFANRYEFIVCCTKGGKLPWSNNLAMGSPPKYSPGGALSHRQQDGERINVKQIRGILQKQTEVSEEAFSIPLMMNSTYIQPKLANPGNIIEVAVGGGKMGSSIAHETEAPFPEKLAEFFVRSCCPPNGIVLDPFGGSGTTMATAVLSGRKSISIDIRDNQQNLMERRLDEAFDRLISRKSSPIVLTSMNELRRLHMLRLCDAA